MGQRIHTLSQGSPSMFSVSLPKTFSLSFPLRVLFFFFCMGTGMVLYLFRTPVLPIFPPVPEEEVQSAPLPARNTAKKSRPPRRDPFRPLDHPPALHPGLPPKPAGDPAAPASCQPPAETVSSPSFRLLGILSVNGNRKALVSTPKGTCLLAPGETLPGKGTITHLQKDALYCGSNLLPVGEVWP